MDAASPTERHLPKGLSHRLICLAIVLFHLPESASVPRFCLAEKRKFKILLENSTIRKPELAINNVPLWMQVNYVVLIINFYFNS